jgi:hemerythrin
MLVNINEVQKVANMFMNAIHEDEIELLNRLYEALKGGNLDEADSLMDEFVQDVEEHFSTEEAMMREAEFFAYPMHKQEHDNMRKEVSRIHSLWKETRDPSEVIRFLEDVFVPWLKLHVATMDSVTAIHIGD